MDKRPTREGPVDAPTTPIAPRDHVAWFASAMEAELRTNDHKGGWDGSSVPWLLHRLHQELGELERAIQHGKPAAQVLSEAADAGNFLMMIADNYRHIEADTRAKRQAQPLV